jgi:hypothetical protein
MSRFVFTSESVDWCATKMQEFSSCFHSEKPQCDSSDNSPVYNVMADAIEWIDERPEGLSSNGTLKQLYIAILNARTALILKEDSTGMCAKLIEHASKALPHWVALHPERRSPVLSIEFQKLRSSGMASIAKNLHKL